MRYLINNLTKLALLALAAMLPQLASAHDFEVGGIYYNKNGNEATVTFRGTSYSQYSNEYTGAVNIPSSVTYNGTTYSVTTIGEYAFSGCSGLTSVTIPNSVTTIGYEAFGFCSGLTSVTIPNSVTTIGSYAFSGCSGLTEVTIPNSVTTIGNGAFYECRGLTSVTIPNSVTTIGNNPFNGCSGLTSMVVESGNTKYDSRNNCNAIIETATNTLISGCKNTIIPGSVTTIGSYAFSGCSGLTSVTIPNSVTTIGNGAFYECRGLTSVTIPNSVKRIGSNAFKGCTGLTSVTIPNSVTSIGNGAFYECTGLTSVTIGNSVTTIGDYAFYCCRGLTSVTIPNSVTTIVNNPFSGCSGLTSMVVESGNTKYDSRNNCNAIIETATNTLISGCKNTIIPGSVTTIGSYAFSGCSGLTEVTIPNSVTRIGSYAFTGCTGLTSVTIPNSVTTIGDWAFSGCTNLTSVEIPGSVTTIGDFAFGYCSGLTEVTIPNSVTWIGNSAFYGCSGLTSLTLTGKGSYPKNMPTISLIKTVNIGSGITSLGNFGFTPDVVNCYAATPPSCSSGTFSNYDGALHVPQASMASYFMADYWQNFNNMVNDLTDKITLDITTANLIQWGNLSLAATVIPENSELVWSTSNPLVAIVDENGIVTAIGEGECDIFATLASNPAVYASCHVIVSYPEITLTLSDESLEMNLSEEQTLTVTITPDNTGLTPTWSSSNTSVATVDENGKVIAVGEGECDITATVLDKSATCHVTVTNNVIITLNLDNAIIGANQALTVYPTCSPDVPVELVVTTSDPSVAVARVINRTNAPAAGLMQFAEEGKALAMMEEIAAPSGSKAPALASEKAIMIVGVQNGTATITVTTADGKATPAVLELRVVDVNGDRVITSSDITQLYSYLLSSDETYAATSDVNGDGNITAADITALYNLLLGN